MATELDRRAYTLDGALAVGAAAFVSVGAWLATAGSVASPGFTELDLVGYLLPILGALALVARRRAPRTVLLVTTLCVLAYQLLGYPGVLTTLPLLVAVYTAVSAGHRLFTVAVVAGGLVVWSLGLTTVADSEQSVREIVETKFLVSGWLLVSGILAEMARKHRAYVREVEQRAEDAERRRDEVARRRATEERVRIARELHDSLTHTISVIKVQAGVAVHLARKRGDDVPDALLAVQEASSEAMRELREALEVLREPTDELGLDRLPELVERVQATGLPVTVEEIGELRPLPADVGRAAYRIVQEALTNVGRHAGHVPTSIRIEYGPDAVVVQVDDEGGAAPANSPTSGVGLLGMRERVARLGGQLDAGPRAEGGFTVRAELPVAAGDRARAGEVAVEGAS